MLIVNNIAQFLQPLVSGHLGRSRRCLLNRSFTVFNEYLYLKVSVPFKRYCDGRDDY